MLRRTFLASALAIKAESASAQTKGEWRNRQSGMAYRQLGRTGYMVSEMVMGGNYIAPNNYDHVLKAIDMGLNYLDTAPAYGNGKSELGYAEVLKVRKRDSVFINSKVSPWDINRNQLYADIYASLDETEQKRLRGLALEEIARRKADAPDYFVGYFRGQREELDAAVLANVMAEKYGDRIDRKRHYKQLILDSVDQTLKRLDTDHLDLLMCPHGANTAYEIANHPEIFEAFEQLKKAGKARHLGVSSHTDPAGVIEAAVKTKMYSAVMVAYNLVNAPYLDGALAAGQKAGLGIVSMKTAKPFSPSGVRPASPAQFAQLNEAVPGQLSPIRKAYLWNLRNKHLTAAISEMVTMQHVEENVPLAGKK